MLAPAFGLREACFRFAVICPTLSIAPQQPVKVVALVGESPIRRIGRFTTERPGACRPCKGAGGISSPGIEPMGLNEDEPQLMSLDIKLNRSRRVAGVKGLKG